MDGYRGFLGLLVSALLVGFLSVIFTLIWVLHYREGLGWDGRAPEFNWHPVLAVTGFIFIQGIGTGASWEAAGRGRGPGSPTESGADVSELESEGGCRERRGPRRGAGSPEPGGGGEVGGRPPGEWPGARGAGIRCETCFGDGRAQRRRQAELARAPSELG